MTLIQLLFRLPLDPTQPSHVLSLSLTCLSSAAHDITRAHAHAARLMSMFGEEKKEVNNQL